MKITNKFNLPQAVVNSLTPYPLKSDKNFSVTQILNQSREIYLRRRHWDELEQDVSECINMLIGTAVHKYLEDHDETKNAEKFLRVNVVGDYFLNGVCDLYDEKEFAIIDYKVVSVWKIIQADYEDFRKQGLMYAWMLGKQGKLVSKLKFHCILKDWTAKDARANKDYPERQVYTWEYEVKTDDLLEIEMFINERFSELISYENASDEDLPDCGEKATWYTGDKYAVYKNANNVKATRVLDTEQEAKDYIKNQLNGVGVIVFRKGEYRKCQDYCDVCKFCKYYEERKAK